MPNQPDPNTVPTSFTLPRQLLALVQKKATEQMTNKSDIIRRALMSYLTPQERKQVEAQMAGMSARELKPTAKEKRARLRDVDTVSMSVFNEMGAGAPLMPSDSPTGSVRVRRGRFPADAFAAYARGESMKGIGVRDGDLVVLRWAENQEARPDDIVCVHLFGEGSVLKQLKERRGIRWLVSRNPAHPDIRFGNDGEPKGHIQAVMIGKL